MHCIIFVFWIGDICMQRCTLSLKALSGTCRVDTFFFLNSKWKVLKWFRFSYLLIMKSCASNTKHCILCVTIFANIFIEILTAGSKALRGLICMFEHFWCFFSLILKRKCNQLLLLPFFCGPCWSSLCYQLPSFASFSNHQALSWAAA